MKKLLLIFVTVLTACSSKPAAAPDVFKSGNAGDYILTLQDMSPGWSISDNFILTTDKSADTIQTAFCTTMKAYHPELASVAFSNGQDYLTNSLAFYESPEQASEFFTEFGKVSQTCTSWEAQGIRYVLSHVSFSENSNNQVAVRIVGGGVTLVMVRTLIGNVVVQIAYISYDYNPDVALLDHLNAVVTKRLK